jgi:serine/threonine-protein phosphatase 6 regulatory subunit 3
MVDGRNQVTGIDDDAEYDSDEDEVGLNSKKKREIVYSYNFQHDNQAITQDWSRGFTEFPQANMLQRTQSHIEEGYDNDDDETDEYDHFADPDGNPTSRQQEQHHRTALSHPNMALQNYDDDDDAFGEFTSASNSMHDDTDDSAWGVSAPLERLDISSDNTAPKTTAGFDNGFGSDIKSGTSSSTISEDHFVRAIRTKEEDEKYKNDYHLAHDEEQEGEI